MVVREGGVPPSLTVGDAIFGEMNGTYFGASNGSVPNRGKELIGDEMREDRYVEVMSFSLSLTHSLSISLSLSLCGGMVCGGGSYVWCVRACVCVGMDVGKDGRGRMTPHKM